MRIGLVSDVHGNRVALDAVVADGVARGVDRWWALGDLVAIGPEPVRTLELLTALPRMTAIAGNTERYVLADDRPPPSGQDVIAHPELLDSVGTIRAINLGSVSNPVTDDLRASYASLHAHRDRHTIEHRRVAYDHDAFLTTIARSGHPSADHIASFHRGEQVRYPAHRPGAPTYPVDDSPDVPTRSAPNLRR